MVLLGIFLGCQFWILGLARGFDRGFDLGIQAEETGQAQLQSTAAGFQDYFMVRALLEGIPGVQAVSARLPFSAVITNAQGQSHTAWFRGVTFTQEDRVTNLLARIQNGVSGPLSGVIIPVSWTEAQFLFPSERAALRFGETSVAVSVTGAMAGAFSSQGREQAVVDLETALALTQGQVAVDHFAIRLKPGIDADQWVASNQSSFQRMPVRLVSWRDVAEPLRQKAVQAAQPLWWLRDTLVALALVAAASLGWWQARRPRAGASWPLHAVVLGVSAGGTAGLLGLTFPLWDRWLLGGLGGVYPFLHPWQLPWAVGPEVVLLPALALLVAFVPAWLKLRTSR